MPILDLVPMMAIDYPGKTIAASMLEQKLQQIYAQAAQKPASPEPLEWAKFSMWLRGFLGALEGKQLTAEDTEKIMEKLATVDPDSQNWRYPQYVPQQPNPWANPSVPQPYANPHWITTTGGSTGTTTKAEEIERLKAYVDTHNEIEKLKAYIDTFKAATSSDIESTK